MNLHNKIKNKKVNIVIYKTKNINIKNIQLPNNFNIIEITNDNDFYYTLDNGYIDVVISEIVPDNNTLFMYNDVIFVTVSNKVSINKTPNHYISSPIIQSQLDTLVLILQEEINNKHQLQQYTEISDEYFYVIDEHMKTVSLDTEMKLKYISTNLSKCLKYNPIELLKVNFKDLLHKKFDEGIWEHICYVAKLGESWEGDIRLKDRKGNSVWLYAKLINNTHDYSIIFEDITNKKRLEMAVITDDLTGLYNRRHFNKKVAEYLNTAKRKQENISLIMLDVDNFRKYNDTYGHTKGDEILKLISKNISECCKRSNDYIFRLGGEEFAVLFQVDLPEQSLIVADKIMKTIKDLKIEHSASDSGYLTVSMGVTSHEALLFETPEDLYITTDLKLFEAKHKGKNIYIS